jgi:hypothetical protein
LDKTLTDLTRHRGLLQYDGRSQRYEMHPVVRSVVTRSLVSNERVSAGERILDHFTALPHNPYRQARSLADLEIGLHIVRTLLKLGRYEGAAHAYEGDLSNALLFNIEAYEEVLSVLRPFFPDGWGTLPQVVETNLATHLACCAAFALRDTGQTEAALAVFGVALIPELSMTAGRKPDGILSNISRTLVSQNRLASALRIDALSLEAGTVFEEDEWIFTSRLYLFNDWITLGQWTEADATWAALDPMGRKWPWAAYRPGRAEYLFALSEFWRGRLDEAHLVAAENLVTQSQNRLDIRRLHQLRGEWQLELGEWRLAVDSLRRAVELAHESRLSDDASETALSLAKHHLDPRSVARSDAERLARLRQPHHRYLGCLWHALGAVDLAKHHALIAYAWAWADGEPYVRRYELTKTKELLNELQIPIPKLSPYDPATSESFPWEADVRAATNELRVEKERNGPGQAAKSTDPGNT